MKLGSIVTGCFLAVSVASSASAAEKRSADTNVLVESELRAPLPKGASPGSIADEKRYAAREAASPEAKTFRGGDAIVISTTAVAIILLVIIIIILL